MGVYNQGNIGPLSVNGPTTQASSRASAAFRGNAETSCREPGLRPEAVANGQS